MKLYPDDWRGRLTAMVTVAAFIVAAKLLGPVVGIRGFWPYMLAIVVAIIVGNVLGRRLFPPSSGGAPEKEKKDEKK